MNNPLGLAIKCGCKTNDTRLNSQMIEYFGLFRLDFIDKRNSGCFSMPNANANVVTCLIISPTYEQQKSDQINREKKMKSQTSTTKTITNGLVNLFNVVFLCIGLSLRVCVYLLECMLSICSNEIHHDTTTIQYTNLPFFHQIANYKHYVMVVVIWFLALRSVMGEGGGFFPLSMGNFFQFARGFSD